MIKIKFFRTVTVFLVWISMVFSQIKFDVSWTPYVTYYLSMVDINTGESNMPIFLAELSRESGAPDSVGVDIEFEIIIDSEALGVNNETLVKVETTQPIFLSAPIHLTNMDLNLASDQIFDDYGNNIPLHLDITEQLDIAAAEDMFSAIVQTGQLPNGVYTFRVIATAENGQQIIKEDILNIANPFMLQLVSPGGILADTTLNEVYTSFPVLQWESDPCNYTDPTTEESGCQYYIRLAEFISDEHSSMGQAIESVTRLPLDQSQGFEQVGFGVSTFQYPTDAGDLVPGKIYVWQVRKDITTTSGTEEIFSDIMAFKVKDFTSTETSESSGDDTSPAGMALRSLIGDELANRLFGDGGDANGMIPNGTITLDGESVDISFIQSIVSMGIATEDENGNETYRAIQIRSVEVSE
ncbi:hypothetical protein OAP60_00120 [bacterium]|nr:hypothetical protein [Candidatus Neomarinimicrobiota bacterium]MDC0645735.1 hypothetical protein [bacterium]